ncbi:MAG: type II secretion system protein [Opitutales bacterium]|nr:type II secretion system protein [Opitutales bacterium]MCH8539720.1 type II secretion system GspH family protein [Opitutales bacterium]
MNTQTLSHKRGFTLIEIIAVLVLLGILTAVAVPRYIDLTAAAEERALDAGVAELNGRENLAWGQAMISGSGSITDAEVWTEMDTDLGSDYSWDGTVDASGGTLEFGGASVTLTRTAATTSSPGRWD